MAVGDIAVVRGKWQNVQLLNAQATNNGVPSGTAAGVDMTQLRTGGVLPPSGAIIITGTRASGTLTGTFRLWGYFASPAAWCPLGFGTAAAKGQLNDAVAIGETTSNEIRHCEPFDMVGDPERLYLELLSVGGTTPSITAYLQVQLVWA